MTCALRRSQGAVLLLVLLEQTHVLDGDHGLVGEGLEQGDLLVGKRSGLGRVTEIARSARLRGQRHGHYAAVAALARISLMSLSNIGSVSTSVTMAGARARTALECTDLLELRAIGKTARARRRRPGFQ